MGLTRSSIITCTIYIMYVICTYQTVLQINSLKLSDGDALHVYMSQDPMDHFITFYGPYEIEGTTDYFTSSSNMLMIQLKTRSLESNTGFSLTYYMGRWFV